MQLPAHVDLRSTVQSHGWSQLPPFRACENGSWLEIATGAGLAKVKSGRISGPAAARRIAASCLRTDLNLRPFWELCRADPDLAWVADGQSGRFLRAPTAWADAIMILATTNCTWGLTIRMLERLVEKFGVDGAFPTQERLKRVRKFGFGYRDPYLAALARGPALEAYRTDDRPTAVVRKELLKLPGFGPYAVDNFLRSIGRFDGYGIDSMVSSRWKAMYPRGRSMDRRFAKFGEWRGLACWMLLTRELHA
jgi:3-methyladenine DNA glycosylase/8-oxoguanine DNA glycosylase